MSNKPEDTTGISYIPDSEKYIKALQEAEKQTDKFKKKLLALKPLTGGLFTNFASSAALSKMKKLYIEEEKLHKKSQDNIDKYAKKTGQNIINNLDKLVKGTITVKELLKRTIQEIAADFAKTQIQELTGGLKGKTGNITGSVLSGLASGLIFDSGGVVPGSFSQPVAATLHGSEMVLNPSQQSNLFNLLNANGQSGQVSQPNYVYAPQIKTGASAHEVFDVLNRHSGQFFSMIADGVQKNTSLRNAVRST